MSFRDDVNALRGESLELRKVLGDFAPDGNPSGTKFYVDGTNGVAGNEGKSWGNPVATITQAVAKATAGAGDVIFVAPGEYDEDVTVDVSQVSLVGVGPRHSVRVTGVALGTSTALTLDGVQDVGVYNLNLEGRSGGSGIELSGQIRRAQVSGCKLHGGAQAVHLYSAAGAQIVDVRFEDNVIANSAIGINMDYLNGDPSHQIVVKGNFFSKITTDCIVEDGATHDWNVYDNVFSSSDGSEATRFIDLDSVGSTGLVANNIFATTTSVDQQAKFALASGVLFVANATEAGWSTTAPTS